jgi:hypothetical protein
VVKEGSKSCTCDWIVVPPVFQVNLVPRTSGHDALTLSICLFHVGRAGAPIRSAHTLAVGAAISSCECTTTGASSWIEPAAARLFDFAILPFVLLVRTLARGLTQLKATLGVDWIRPTRTEAEELRDDPVFERAA